MKDEKVPDRVLVKKAQSGDRAAFETLCDRYLPYVYNRLRALLPAEAVEDVTQEVFVGVLRGLRRFQGRSLFRTWLSNIARHKVADYYRRRGRRPSIIPLNGSGASSLVRPEGFERRVIVRTVLRRLPTDYQEILLLRFAEGLPFKQIAAVLNISHEAARSRYRRALSAIAQELGYAE
ncbi:MAG: sigma-70 family RNA polymerase sigma factor [Anaerolineae bacterium]|jgi:RNA polymerase sigma-70 factor (ECF subfamily)